MIVVAVPLEGSEELGRMPLFVPGHVLLKRTSDRGGPGALAADLQGLFQQLRLDVEVGSHVRGIARCLAQAWSDPAR